MTKKKTEIISKNSQEVSLNNYQVLLTKIRQSIDEAGQNISRVATREKVVMAWNIGKLIDENLKGSDRANYGDQLFKQLEADVLIKERTLYKMHSFYQSYPALPKDDEKLNWSHYSHLAQIRNSDKRQYLENLAIENDWSVDELADEVSRVKGEEKGSKTKSKNSNSEFKSKKKLTPVRGQLFTYPIIELVGQKFIDLGFENFKEVETRIDADTTVKSTKSEAKAESYSFKEVEIQGKKLNIYKAYLERVVDADTIRVVLDLGFKMHHREIIRLKAVNAPELSTEEGKKSSKILNKILKDKPFLIIKTIKIDIYGRYVADVFFDETNDANIDPQKVADEGVYLNQLLLDEGVVSILEGDY